MPPETLSLNLNLDLLTKLLHNKKSKVNTMITRLRLMNQKHWKATATLLLLRVPILMQMTLRISMQIWISMNSIPTCFFTLQDVAIIVGVERNSLMTKIRSLYHLKLNLTANFFQTIFSEKLFSENFFRGTIY